MHVSLVGGEPLVRRKELDQILPQLNQFGVFTLLVTALSLDFLEISRGGWAFRRRFLVGISAVDERPAQHDPGRHPKLVLGPIMNRLAELAQHVIDLDRSNRHMLADDKVHAESGRNGKAASSKG
jgi:hypothetical protein